MTEALSRSGDGRHEVGTCPPSLFFPATSSYRLRPATRSSGSFASATWPESNRYQWRGPLPLPTHFVFSHVIGSPFTQSRSRRRAAGLAGRHVIHCRRSPIVRRSGSTVCVTYAAALAEQGGLGCTILFFFFSGGSPKMGRLEPTRLKSESLDVTYPILIF